MRARILTACVALAAAFAASTPALAEGDGLRMIPAPAHRLDDASLQRGARDFVNYCMGCHSAKYMRYNRLTEIGLTEDQIKNNLMFGDAKIGDTMTIAMSPVEAKGWFGNAPPDLSVIARVRGNEWLYNYLLGFYRDDKSATGWNNLVFHNVGMPHVLWQLQGTRVLKETEFEEYPKAVAAAIAARTLTSLEQAPGGKYVLTTLEMQTPGTMNEQEYGEFAADLVNYLDFIAEPAKNQRIRLGMLVVLFLGVLFILAYLTKRDYWSELH
ncbi:MAG: cytochrome c1 [Proteobacteria bacterium]|nr:cytochrome c1 [Pseudomonadota bacterium]